MQNEINLIQQVDIQSIICGILIGFICGFIGAGGGMMMLLILTSVLGYELKTSVFIMTFTAFTGAVSSSPLVWHQTGVYGFCVLLWLWHFRCELCGAGEYHIEVKE